MPCQDAVIDAPNKQNKMLLTNRQGFLLAAAVMLALTIALLLLSWLVKPSIIFGSHDVKMTITNDSNDWDLIKPFSDVKITSIFCDSGECQIRYLKKDTESDDFIEINLAEDKTLSKISSFSLEILPDHAYVESHGVSKRGRMPHAQDVLVVLAKKIPTMLKK